MNLPFHPSLMMDLKIALKENLKSKNDSSKALIHLENIVFHKMWFEHWVMQLQNHENTKLYVTQEIQAQLQKWCKSNVKDLKRDADKVEDQV